MDKNRHIINIVLLIVSLMLMAFNIYIFFIENGDIKSFALRITGNILIAAIFVLNLYKMRKLNKN